MSSLVKHFMRAWWNKNGRCFQKSRSKLVKYIPQCQVKFISSDSHADELIASPSHHVVATATHRLTVLSFQIRWMGAVACCEGVQWGRTAGVWRFGLDAIVTKSHLNPSCVPSDKEWCLRKLKLGEHDNFCICHKQSSLKRLATR
jgi:hypothetical protein